MTVKQLINQLKKMPQNLEVGTAAHDNSEYEVQGWACSVDHLIKADFDPENDGAADVGIIDDCPDEYVVIRC